ncbi:hypothetical protein SDC9_30585 [bioreactor metagenome]|uniref:Uncharacterized protein n=1 Tax=bioreactor metagenome TaxID=1076179 RepID=A0A644UZW5_9ZZZZ
MPQVRQSGPGAGHGNARPGRGRAQLPAVQDGRGRSAAGRGLVPVADRLALRGLHEAQIARRHGMGQPRLHIDLMRGPRDLGRVFQMHALRRPGDTVKAARFGRMAHRAAAEHDIGHLLEARRLREARLDRAQGRFRVVPLAGAGEAREPDADQKQHHGHPPGPPRRALVRVMGVEEVPDRHPHQEHQRGDQPVVLAREGQRVMVRQHQEHHRQRQVVVVRRALLGDLAVFRVRRAAGLQIGHHDALVRHDDQEHVRGHDRRGEGAKVQQRRAAREHLRIAPGHRHQDDVKQHHQRGAVLAEPRLAQQVIEDPADRQRPRRDRDRAPGRQVHHPRVDQVELRLRPVEQHQHGKARHPGHVAFPFEPGQLVGHPLGRHHVFLDVVEATAMHLPGGPGHPLRRARFGPQAKVQRDEVEGRPDPGDGGDDMQPAHRELRPLEQEGIVEHHVPVFFFRQHRPAPPPTQASAGLSPPPSDARPGIGHRRRKIRQMSDQLPR